MAVLQQTAAIVEGVVSSVDNEYTDETGPWTKITLSEVTVHRGHLKNVGPNGEVIIRHRGGLFPDGRILAGSHIPGFTRGERYLLFLRNTSWNLLPFVGPPLRIAEVQGRTLLLDPYQRAVTGLSGAGFDFSSRPLFTDRDLGVPTLFRDKAYPRNSEALPSTSIGVQGLFYRIDAEINVRRLEFRGEFYDEPKNPSRRRTATPHAPKESSEPKR